MPGQPLKKVGVPQGGDLPVSVWIWWKGRGSGGLRGQLLVPAHSPDWAAGTALGAEATTLAGSRPSLLAATEGFYL